MASDLATSKPFTESTCQYLIPSSNEPLKAEKVIGPQTLKSVIVDTGAFIRLKRLDALAENFITTPGVADEIKDKRARQNTLTTIKGPLIRQPTADYIARVKDFTISSGDFSRLSITDLHLIALTLMISDEEGDISTIRSQPLDIKLNFNNSNTFQWSPETSKSPSSSDDESHLKYSNEITQDEDEPNSSDNEGWITSENIHRLGNSISKPSNIRVACLTTDYTIQNVLLKMGLHIISIDGYQITRVKNWILKCQGCHHLEYDSTKIFCQRCGNNTLVSLTVTTDSKGQTYVNQNKRPPKLRGTIFSLPKPRNSKNLILCEDQMIMGGRDRELRHQMKLWEKNIAEKNPFNFDAFNQNEWWHRNFTPSGKLEMKGYPKMEIGVGKGNPNSNRWVKKKGKMKN